MSKTLDPRRGIAAPTVGPLANGEPVDDLVDDLASGETGGALRGNAAKKAPRRARKTNILRRKKGGEELRAVKGSIPADVFKRLKTYATENDVNISVALGDLLDRILPFYRTSVVSRPEVEGEQAGQGTAA